PARFRRRLAVGRRLRFDRWKAGASGAAVSASASSDTLTSGDIIQPMEAAAFGLSGFAGMSVTFSIEELSDQLRVTVGSAHHDFAAGRAASPQPSKLPAITQVHWPSSSRRYRAWWRMTRRSSRPAKRLPLPGEPA